MCFAPLLLIGTLLTLQPNHTHVTSLTSALLEVQTCHRGLGAYAKASPAGLGSLGLQYGLTWSLAPQWTFTVTPQLGLGLTQEVQELSTVANISLSTQMALGYDDMRLAVGYWHLSNAGLGARNAGLDLVTVMVGWVVHD